MNSIEDIDLKQLIENETGEFFNNQGYICCPFHNEKTPSLKVKFNSDKNKYKFKCFGCDESGDAIDFIRKYKSLSYKEAREYLGLEVEKNQNELDIEKIKKYIKWQIDHQEDKKDCKLIGLFQFVDENNNALYYKAKLLYPNGKKITPYYHIENGKIINNRKYDEIPYNLYNVMKALDENKIIVILEGEKDANTINYLLRNTKYVATSIKNCKNLEMFLDKNARIYVLGDTGDAGDKYKNWIYDELFEDAEEFKFINLPGLKALGNNKDVTDWIESGKTKYDLLSAFKRSLNLKDNNTLQQDWKGIYKPVWDKNTERYKPMYITDFQLLEAKRLIFDEDEKEGIKLILKSSTGAIVTRIGFATVFDDIRSFKNFMATMDLSFTSKYIEDLTLLKRWINQYWAIDNERRYNGVQYVKKDDKYFLVTPDGALGPKNIIDYSLVADIGSVKIIDKEPISTDELIEVKNNIFKFWNPEKSISIIGSVISGLATHLNEDAGCKQHTLLIVGESSSGKSTILEQIIAPIMNYDVKDKKSFGTSASAFESDLAKGNYPVIYDEYKPSMMDSRKLSRIGDDLRYLFDRQTISKGSKSFNIRNFRLRRPIIMAGEESFPNAETAAITRSCIVYLSRKDRDDKNKAAIDWIHDHQSLLNKFGRSLIDTILEMSADDYKEIRKFKLNMYEELKERTLSTALNITCGIEIFNRLIRKHGLKEIRDYEKYIYQNIKDEILDNGTDTKSITEQMICLYDQMISDDKAFDYEHVIIDKGGEYLFIRTTEMINQIFRFVKEYGSAELIPLKARDFKKQATKAGYIIAKETKVIKINGKATRFDYYSKKKLRELKVNSIIEDEITPIEMTASEQKIIEGYFDKEAN